MVISWPMRPESPRPARRGPPRAAAGRGPSVWSWVAPGFSLPPCGRVVSIRCWAWSGRGVEWCRFRDQACDVDDETEGPVAKNGGAGDPSLDADDVAERFHDHVLFAEDAIDPEGNLAV